MENNTHKPTMYELFKYISDEFNYTALDSEIHDVVILSKKYIFSNLTKKQIEYIELLIEQYEKINELKARNEELKKVNDEL